MSISGDLTVQAVHRQIHAMGCKRYIIGLNNFKTNVFINLRCSSSGVFHKIPFMKYQNANGCDVYIKPSDDISHSLILLDDIDRITIELMKKHGFTPALVVETSPHNFQAWLKIDSVPLSPHERMIAAKILTAKYEADPLCVGYNHFGRLAGFTNQKPKHSDSSGRHPWAICRFFSGEYISLHARQQLLADIGLRTGYHRCYY